jgi:hypothetical protein
MAGTTGLEPATSAVTGQRSDQLSYVPKLSLGCLENAGKNAELFLRQHSWVYQKRASLGMRRSVVFTQKPAHQILIARRVTRMLERDRTIPVRPVIFPDEEEI